MSCWDSTFIGLYISLIPVHTWIVKLIIITLHAGISHHPKGIFAAHNLNSSIKSVAVSVVAVQLMTKMLLLPAAAVVLLVTIAFIAIVWPTYLLANGRRRMNFAMQEGMRSRDEASALVFGSHAPLPIRSINEPPRAMHVAEPIVPRTLRSVGIKFRTELEATLQATSYLEWCMLKCIQRRNHWGVTRGLQCVFKVLLLCPTDFVCIYFHAGSQVWFCKALPHCIVASTAYTCNNHIVNLYFPTPTLHIWAYPLLFSVTICNDVWIHLNVGKLIM